MNPDSATIDSVLGNFSLLLALALGAYSLIVGGISLRLIATGGQARVDPVRMLETARRAGIGTFVAVTTAAICLVYASFTGDYTVSYILHHTNHALPMAYKFSALWSGQEGSLLLWAWLLAAYGFVVRMTHKRDPLLTGYASTILAAIQVFFLLLLVIAAPPFAIQPGPLATDGFGLNPLLQYPEMVIHPPMLYLGYVGFSVPFAFALGALMMRYPGEKWIHVTRHWTMITWLFLTFGISLGMHWAYNVLGWGGYWGWDPVENASLLPWLTATAFLHSVMMQEKRGMMKSWNVWLITTFMLSILGTLLTRSGIVSSVHAFAESSIGGWFTTFLVITLCVCLFTYLRNRDHLKSEHHLESLVSRESSFLFNNLLFLAACFAVLWGTLFPVLSQYVTGSKVTVVAPFYDRVVLPIGLALLFLMGIGPQLPWRSTSMQSVRRNLILPGLATLATAIALVALGVHPWNSDGYDQAHFFSLMAFSIGAGCVTAIATEFQRGAAVLHRQTGLNYFSSLILLVRRNTRRYGGYLVHFGIVVMFIGIAGGAFNQKVEESMSYNDTVNIGGYKVVFQSFSQDSNDNYQTEYAFLDVYKDGKKITRLAPEMRLYLATDQPSTIVANHSTLASDLYIIYGGKNATTGQPVIIIMLHPLINWIWIGVLIVVFGTAIALVPNSTAPLRKASNDAPEKSIA
jgi:cytochrome c-type biogenesis protein CcmF